MSALSIESLTVRADRIVCDVVLSPDTPHMTTPALARRIRAAFPNVAHHACVNDKGDTFGAVMDATPIPHVFEHLVIDLQTAAEPPGSKAVFVGTSEWTDASAGHARIAVSFTDDLVALRCFRDAASFLNGTMVP